MSSQAKTICLHTTSITQTVQHRVMSLLTLACVVAWHLIPRSTLPTTRSLHYRASHSPEGPAKSKWQDSSYLKASKTYLIVRIRSLKIYPSTTEVVWDHLRLMAHQLRGSSSHPVTTSESTHCIKVPHQIEPLSQILTNSSHRYAQVKPTGCQSR